MAAIKGPVSHEELQTLVHDTTLLEEEQRERLAKEAARRRYEEILASLALPEENLSPEAVYRITDRLGLKRENVNTAYNLRHPELSIPAEPSQDVQERNREERFRTLMAEYGTIFQQRIEELPRGQFRLGGDLKYRRVAADHSRFGHDAHVIRKAAIVIEEVEKRRFLWDRHRAVARISIDDSDVLQYNFDCRRTVERDDITDTVKTHHTIRTDIYQRSFSLFEDTYKEFSGKARAEFRVEKPVRHF